MFEEHYMRRKLIIVIVFIVVAFLGFLIYRFTRKPEQPVKPPATDDTPLAEANKELREQAARLTDEDLLFLTGQLVVERLGSYQTWDENYKNIRSVQSYVTENLNQRLEKIMARVVEPDAPQFEQITTVVGKRLVEQGIIGATAVYTVDVWRSDTDKTTREEVTVEFEKFKDWFVSGTSQIKE